MDMTATNDIEKKRMHPHKFVLWVAMGSIVMMFAGLTSAYIVKRNDGNWLEFPMPSVFWYSTVTILISSVTIFLAQKSFKAREMARYRTLINITALLGVLFAVLQVIGFIQLGHQNIKLFGTGSNPSASFLGIITGLHVLHVLGGVIALIVLFFRAHRKRVKSYNSVPIEIVGTYWHFVDILWIYLFIFFNMVGGG